MKSRKIFVSVLFVALMVATPSIQMCPAGSSFFGSTYQVTTIYGGNGHPFTYGWREPADDGNHKGGYDPVHNCMYARVLAPFCGDSQTVAMLSVRHSLLSDKRPIEVSAKIRYIWASGGFGIAYKSGIAFEAQMLGEHKRVETYSIPSITIPVEGLHELMLMIEGGRTAWDIYDFLQKSGSPPDTWPCCELNFEIPGKFSRNTTDTLTILATSWASAGLATSWSNVFVWVESVKITETVEPTTSITGTYPQDGQKGIPANSDIKVTFNGPVDRASAEGAFHISPSVTGTFSWDSSSSQMTFTPKNSLSPKTAYTVTVDTTAADTRAIPLVNTPYTWTFETVETPRPDIIVESIEFSPLTASIGDSVKIIVTVKNAGTADAAGEGYYSLDVYDGTELLYSTRGSPTKEPLKPGGVIIADSRWWSFTTAGDHIIKAVVDPENKVQELDETNNEKTAPLSIGGSDFTVSATPASLTVIQGEQATSTITIISKGKFSGQISLSCTVSDKLFSNKPTVTVSIEPAILTLESNGEVNATLTIRIGQNCPAGTKLVTVSASDNTKTHSVQVTVEIPKPDLVWYPIKIEPPEPKEGDPLSIEAILANQGPGKVSGGFTVRLEIIKYPYEIGELVYERELTVLTDLNPRSFWKFSWEDQGFTFEAANYEIRLIADPYNRIDEWNEDNNTETISIWVSYMSYLYRNAGFNQMKSGGASILCHMEIERDKVESDFFTLEQRKRSDLQFNAKHEKSHMPL
jgi:hypothetical protein